MASTASSLAQQCDDDAALEHELAAWHEAVRHRAWTRVAREPLQPLQPLRIAALVFVLLLHALLLWALRNAMHKPPLAQVEPVQVRLILESASFESAEPPLPQPPPLPARPVVTRPPALPRALPHDAPRPAPPAAPAPESPALHVFNPDGSIDLPREGAPKSDALTATFTSPPPSDEALRIMRHQRPLKMRPNHFAQQWKQPGTTALEDFIADHLTFEQEFTLPWGTHVKCGEVFLLIAAAGGCGWETPYRYYVPTEKWRPASSLDED